MTAYAGTAEFQIARRMAERSADDVTSGMAAESTSCASVFKQERAEC